MQQTEAQASATAPNAQGQVNGMNIDINVLNQYETALKLMNTEIQKLLTRNDQL